MSIREIDYLLRIVKYLRYQLLNLQGLISTGANCLARFSLLAFSRATHGSMSHLVVGTFSQQKMVNSPISEAQPLWVMVCWRGLNEAL